MTSSSFEQEVSPLIADLLASANAHDTDRHCDIYARDPSLAFVANGEVIRGWDAYRERQRQWWNDDRSNSVYEYRGEPIYQPVGENLGLTTLIIVARTPLPDGQVRKRELLSSALWSKRSGQWRIIYAHESSAN